MSKLFLTSKGITENLVSYFQQTLKTNRHRRPIPKGYIIENASDYKGISAQKKLRKYYEIIRKKGIKYDFLDLRNYKNKGEDLNKTLDLADFVYISGGNIFYLYYWIVKSGFKQIIKKQLENSLIYAGSSAGSVIAGPTIKYFDEVDNISISPDPTDIDWGGLNLVDFAIIPHWGEEKYKHKFNSIKEKLINDGVKVKTLNNKQAFFIENGKIKLIEE